MGAGCDITVRMPLQTLEKVQERLKQERAILGRWEAVALKNGLSVGTVCRVASGYNPKAKHIRERLGLPVLLPVPVCLSCGQVHIRKGCPAQQNGRRPHRPRIAIAVDDPASAARSIRRYLPPDRVRELVGLLLKEE